MCYKKLYNIVRHWTRSAQIVSDMDFFRRIYRFYADGFRSMTIGRTLWLVIVIKLVVMFIIIRLLFMPDALGGLEGDDEKSETVRKNLTEDINCQCHCFLYGYNESVIHNPHTISEKSK